jgi:WD40 repeat protein
MCGIHALHLSAVLLLLTQGAITRLRVSWDEQLLATASDDGSLFVYDVRDRDVKVRGEREPCCHFTAHALWSAALLNT